MAVKKKLLLFAVFLLFFSLLAADWKKETAAQIGREKDYPLLLESLLKYFSDLPDSEKAAVCLISGYCQFRMNNPQAELAWMKKYFEEFKAAKVDVGFIAAPFRQKLIKFKDSWQKDFPVLWELSLAAENSEIAYFNPPAELKLRVQLSVPSDFKLFGQDGTLLTTGVLGKEPQVVAFPVAADYFKQASHSFRLLLTLNHAPEKEIEKYFAIELQYLFPEKVVFDPLSAELKLKGKEWQPETKTESIVLSRHTVFDKTAFKKSFLKNLLIGTAFFVVRSTLLASTMDNPDTSLYLKSALYGTRKVCTLAGFAFSLEALRHLPKVFKREKIIEEKTVDLPEARAANENLQRELALSKKAVLVRLAVKII